MCPTVICMRVQMQECSYDCKVHMFLEVLVIKISRLLVIMVIQKIIPISEVYSHVSGKVTSQLLNICPLAPFVGEVIYVMSIQIQL